MLRAKSCSRLLLLLLVIYPPAAEIIHIFSFSLHMYKTDRNLQKVANLKLKFRLILSKTSLNINLRQQ